MESVRVRSGTNDRKRGGMRKTESWVLDERAVTYVKDRRNVLHESSRH